MVTFTIFNSEPDVRSFTAGEVIFEEGLAGDHMYAVLDGEVDIKRHERLLETITAGACSVKWRWWTRSGAAPPLSPGAIVTWPPSRPAGSRSWCRRTRSLRRKCCS